MALYMLSGERFENKLNIEWPNPFQDDYPGFDILGSSSINGILCLYRYVKANVLAVMWNLSTKELKVVPCLPDESMIEGDTLLGFGFDHLKQDYKVIRETIFYSHINNDLYEYSYETIWQVYSLRSDSWNKLDIDNIPSCCGNYSGQRLYMDGVCHWWGQSKIDVYGTCLVSFNMSTEVFVTTPIPSDVDNLFDINDVWRHLVVLNGSIGLISNYLKIPTFYISILGKFGVENSWIKLFTIGPLPDIQYPIGAGKNGNIFFRKEGGEVVWFDLLTHKFEEIGIKVQHGSGNIVIYK